MAVDLQYYLVDQTNGQKSRINDVVSFGNMFKGSQSKVCITVFNAGDTTAVSPVMEIQQYPTGNYSECHQWKQISMNETDGYSRRLELPDIKPNSWLEGKDIVAEDFNNYPQVAGTKPDQTWLLWKQSDSAWEVYNGWLQHNVDSMDGRALWTELISAKDYDFYIKMTVRDGVYSGVIMRDEGDSNTGYIILIQGMSGYLGDVQSNEGVIQVFDGKFTDGIESWELLYTSPSVGIRGTHDPFRIRLTGNKFEFWYGDDSTPSPKYSWIDTEYRHAKASKPVLCTHAGFGSVLVYFDDIKQEVANENGQIWIQNQVDVKTPVFSTQRTLLSVEYGGVE